MNTCDTFGYGLGSLPLLGGARTRSVCPENPTGEKGRGGMAIPDPEKLPFSHHASELGQGWKVNPFCKVKAGETLTIMDVSGPGIIQHIWLVVTPMERGRAFVIRFYWDDEQTPSVECPITDFFAVGHDTFAPVNSLPVIVNPKSAFNCYWPMPFRKHAKITVTNEDSEELDLLTYQITYAETPVPENAGMFHAQWRRAHTADHNPYTILDGVSGKGRYVGTFLAWTQMEKGWFGEGEIKFYMDGDDRFPTICGTGTEDYFLGSYGFPESYSTAYAGTVLPSNENAEPPQYWSLYRWHIHDPIQFDQDLRVTIQALGWGKKYRKLAKDDIASVAYWYQAEPHTTFPQLPGLKHRRAR